MRSRPVRRRRLRTEAGYVAILVSVLVPVVFIGCSAIAVDTSRWYLEMQRVQKAADAAALAGVPFLPQDLPSAVAKAKEVAKRNGYDDASADVAVTVRLGDRASQLDVTISSRLDNVFGSMIGVNNETITQSAAADYTGPAPMGSPCNTFGNEPVSGSGGAKNATGGTGSALPASYPADFKAPCTSTPQFWGTIEGPQTGKVQGDRYQTKACSGAGVDGCTGTGANDEYEEAGYFWVVKVQPEAVGTPIDVQLYDPAFVNTPASGNGANAIQCGSLPAQNAASMVDNMNPWVGTDGSVRYANPSSQPNATKKGSGFSFCTGDYFPGGGSSLMTTTFALRQQTDTHNPNKAPIQNDTSGSPCIKQYKGQTTTPVVKDLLSTSTTYDDQLAQVFHNWVSLCTFTPTRDGDYYLQVRSNISAGGSSLANTHGNPTLIYSGNSHATDDTGNTTTGAGDNSFGLRAVTQVGKETAVSVSGYNHMPIYANADSASSTFNLIRVLPGAAGQYVSFSFYDAADISGSGGTVKVLPPVDSTNPTFPGGCRGKGAGAGAGANIGTGCSAGVSNSANNGKTETIIIPIPTNYTCNATSLGGCWYQVKVSFPGAKVSDITTWDATVIGDPVRLVK